MQRTMFFGVGRWLAGIVLALCAVAAWADPPARVARLSYVEGALSFSPAADPDSWVEARRNRPLFIGDRLWGADNARAELELGTAVVRAAGPASVTILNLDDQFTQLELNEGRMNVRVRTLRNDETFEIDTPNLAFVITAPGQYRIDVDPQGDSTIVAVRDGRGEAYGENRSYGLARGQSYRFYGTELDNDLARVPALDPFDRWALARDGRYDRAVSARYVARTVIGYEDLDEYGTWTSVADYGNVWIPRNVAADWVPYREGHWVWIDPWGWTWVDDAPWGFAPFHYGRWVRVQERWGWVPGPTNVQPVYAPALVAFVGGDNFTVNIGGSSARAVAWFPLAPGEIYRPAYRVSERYFTAINVTNTRVSNTVVVNVFNHPDAREVRYRYREAPAAVTAVAANAFVESRPVARAALPAQQMGRVFTAAPVSAAPTVAPARASVVGAAEPARQRPPQAVVQRQVVARREPPAAAPAFAPHERSGSPAAAVDASAVHNPAPLRPRDRVHVIAAGDQADRTGNDRRLPPPPPHAATARERPGQAPRENDAARGPGAPATAAAPAPTPAQPNGDARARDRGPAAPTAAAAAPGTTPPPARGNGRTGPEAAGAPPAAARPEATPAQRDDGRARQPATPTPAPAQGAEAGRTSPGAADVTAPGAARPPRAARPAQAEGAAPAATPGAPARAAPAEHPAPAARPAPSAPAERVAPAAPAARSAPPGQAAQAAEPAARANAEAGQGPQQRSNGRGRPPATAQPASPPPAEARPTPPAEARPTPRARVAPEPPAAPAPPAPAAAPPRPKAPEPAAQPHPNAKGPPAPPPNTGKGEPQGKGKPGEPADEKKGADDKAHGKGRGD